jgi:hypothetical protein
MPDEILIATDSGGKPMTYMDRDLSFYLALTIFILTNLSIYVLLRLIRKLDFSLSVKVFGWLSGLVVIINLFFAFVVAFIGILNSRDNFDYANFGYLVYVIGGVFFVWLIGFMISMIKGKLTY